MNRKTLVVLVGLCAAVGLYAQDTPDTPQQAPAAGGRGGRGAANADPQPYDRVITKDAKTSKGVFTVHQIKDQYYYEIPKSELGKDFLWNSQIAKTAIGVGYGGGQYAELVVRWEQKGNRVLLEDVNYSVTADPKSPIAKAVKAANNDAIIMSFPVAAFKDGDPVIDVTRLFVPAAGGGGGGGAAEVPEISARQHVGASGVDATRSFIEHITPFPENVESEVTMTYTNNAGRGGAAAGGGRGGGLGGGSMRGSTATVVLHHSMVKLPEKPMMPRMFDNRVGYFTTRTQDFSHDEYKSENVQYIARWRLEKKNPSAAVSDPVKPIVYYLDEATPSKWVPWLIKGIEDWNIAFKEAGFSNAIIGKKAPTAQEDPTWSPEDVRHSVIRWLPSTTENASGPHISDPRTGEILNADIQFYNDVMVLARDWYFTQVGPLDPRAQKLPLPDELMGRLLEYVVCHEVGHTLGFQHNMKASSEYPFEKIRDAKWVHEMGHTPSIMDYSRFNYVAQPEDHIAVEDLVPRIGPYDIWATKWGYAPIPGANTSDEEKPTLNKWSKEQDDKPWLRFSTANAQNSDPGDETEAVGDADAVKATALGVKNLQRVAKMLMTATAWKEGETYDDLREMYGRVVSQWQTEMNHVTQIVGGFNSQEKAIGQEGRIFSLVEKERQAEAVKFLLDNAFTTPMFLVDEEILRRIEAVGVLDRIRTAQNSVLTSLLNDARFGRLIEQETLDGTRAYSPVDFLTTVRKGVWKELDNPTVKIDAYRRNLQRSYLTLVSGKINPAPAAAAAAPAGGGGGGRGGRGGGEPGDEKSMYRAELHTLKSAITAAMAKATDPETKAHLEASRDEIDKILDPKFLPAAPAAAAAAGGRGGLR